MLAVRSAKSLRNQSLSAHFFKAFLLETMYIMLNSLAGRFRAKLLKQVGEVNSCTSVK